jgi:hypothetical protein
VSQPDGLSADQLLNLRTSERRALTRLVCGYNHGGKLHMPAFKAYDTILRGMNPKSPLRDGQNKALQQALKAVSSPETAYARSKALGECLRECRDEADAIIRRTNPAAFMLRLEDEATGFFDSGAIRANNSTFEREYEQFIFSRTALLASVDMERMGVWSLKNSYPMRVKAEIEGLVQILTAAMSSETKETKVLAPSFVNAALLAMGQIAMAFEGAPRPGRPLSKLLLGTAGDRIMTAARRQNFVSWPPGLLLGGGQWKPINSLHA